MRRCIFLTLILVAITAQADLLTDIVSEQYKPQYPNDMIAMSDGEHYAQLSDGNIVSYEYRTGQIADTLFSQNNTKITRLDTVEGFLLSPSERYLLVYNNSQRIFRRSRMADWYIYDRQKSELKPLSDQLPVRAPVFSPNGKYIAFSRDNNIFIHKLDFSTEVAVTTDGKVGSIINGTSDWLYEEEFTITSQYEFSPDSKQLAFVRLDETDVPTFTWQTYLSGNDKYQYPANHEIKYPRAGEKNSVASVVVYDLHYKSLKTIQLPHDIDAYIPRIRWTASPEQLAIFRLNRNQNKLEMYVANPKSSVAKLIYTEGNKNGFVDYDEVDEWEFLEDNTMVVVNETDGWRQAYLYSLNGQKLRKLTNGKFDITHLFGYDPSTQTLFYQAALPDALNRTVYALNVKKSKAISLSSQNGINNAEFSAGYKYVVLSHSSATEPLSYTLVSRDGKTLRKLFDNDELTDKVAAAGLPQKTFFSFRTERGDTLNGWIMLPPDMQPSEKCPLLLYQYSGPASQEVLNRWKIDWEHYLVKEKRIIVACVDPRGTNARGREFRNLTYMNLGQKEAEDQISAAKYIASLGNVDEERMAIWGWSYGGFQTLMTMSQADSHFRCGIAVAPVTDFRLYDSAYTERFMRRPQSNENGYKACALPLMAESLNGRVLLVHGVADDNVHCQNMWIYIDALVRAGKQFDMQIYPDDNHFLRKRGNYQHLYRRMTDFLDANLIENNK